MAASSGISLNYMENGDISSGVSSTKHNELRKKMEKLHRSYIRGKEWKESMRVVQQNLSRDKKMMVEEKDVTTIRSCLDRLQSCIKVVSQQTLLERLEASARQVGLMFTIPASSEKSAIISNEMFRIEIIFDPGGLVKDVRVSHQGEPSSCDEILEVLRQGNFEEFIVHLKGLQNIYNVPGDRKQKSKLFLALQALETDLNGLAQLQSSIKGVSNCIHKSPLGILLPRKGGCPMKLVYYVSPYDLLNKKSRSPYPMTVEAITENGLGQSVTVCIEQHPHRRLQTIPLMSVIQQDGKSLPSFQALSQVNSTSLPACFTLVLAKPIPVAVSIIQAIQEVTDIDVITEGAPDTLLQLLLSQSSNGKARPGSEFYVTLPDQQHAYYLTDIGESSLDQTARMVSRIPFTHPTNVANILNLLRQQLLFNTVVSSCIRPYAKQDLLSSVVFQLVCTSLQHFSVMFEHPLQDTMVTAEVDLSDITGVKFRVSVAEEGEDLLSDDAASKIFQRCLSIPVTLRSVIHKVSEQLRKEPSPEPSPVSMETDHPPFVMPAEVTFATPYLPSLDNKTLTSPANLGIPNVKIPPGFGGFPVPNSATVGTMLPPPPVEDSKKVDADVPGSNPLLVTLLDQDSPDPDPPPVNESPMLSKLLEDAPLHNQASLTNNNNNNVANLASSVPVPLKSGRGRPPKRKSVTESPRGKSPKHRLTESEFQSHSFDSISSFDSDFQTGIETPRSHHFSLSSPIDLTEDSVNPLRRLENTLDSIQSKTSHHPSDPLSDLSSELESMQDVNIFNQTTSVPKNMARSTSLEGILNRSGEASRTNDLLKPHHHLQNSTETPNHQTRKTLTRQNSVGRGTQFQQQMSVDSNDSFKLGSNLSFSRSTSFTQGNISDSDTSDQTSLYSSKSFDVTDSLNFSPMSNSSVSRVDVGDSSENKIVHKDLRSLLLGSPNENSVLPNKELKIKNAKGKMRMKLSGIKNSDLLGINNKKSSAEAYDFNSDEEDCNDLKMMSASPAGLHLFNKSKNAKHFLNKYGKSDKLKKKEAKNTEPGKRKRDKKEKEHKKRKRLESNSRGASCEMYSATPVESEDKTSTKLKIIKSVGLSMENSPRSSPSSRDKGDGVKKYESKSNVNSQKSGKNSHKSLSMSSVSVSKEDSKLMTKTPKIKLKPIAIPSSSAVTSAKTPTPTSSPTQCKSGSSTPTSTTIGRIGAVSILTSGNSKTGTITPPPGKVTTPTSSKTPLPFGGSSKTFPSNKNVASSSSTSQKAAAVERKLSQSSRLSSGISKSSNGKYSSERKSGSPSFSGSKSSLNSSKSLNSSSKGQSSTSFGKNSTNPLNSVLSFLNPKDKGLSSLPRIPKISSASSSNVNSTKTTVSMTTTTVTMTTTVATSVAGTPKITTVNSHTGTKVSVSNQFQGGLKNSPSSLGTPKTPTGGNFLANTKSNVNLTSGHKGNISGGNSPSVRGNQLGNRSPSISNSSNNKSPSSSGKSPLSQANKPGNVSRQNSNSNPPRTPVGGNTSHPLKTPPSASTSPNINKLNSSSVSNSASKTIPQSSPSNYPTKPATGQGSSAMTSSRNSNSPVVSQSLTSKTMNNLTKASESPKSVMAASKVTSPITLSLETPPKTTASSLVSPTISCPSSNSKIRPRKSSLSAVIDKLTNAKVPHGLGGEINRQNSVDEPEQTKQKTESSLESVDRANGSSEKHGSDLKSDSSDKSIPTKDVSSGIDKNKDYKIVDNSRNLFASLLKSASENFSSRHDKDDKENVAKNEVGKSVDVNEEMESKIKDLSMQTNSKKSPKASPKVNGETATVESVRKEGDVFKVPTPKSVVAIDEMNCEDIENMSVRRKARISTTKPVLSPASSGGSPENLIIDCQSPRQNISKNNSPKCVIDLNEENKKLSPVTVVSFRQKTHTPSPKPKPSPNPSPRSIQHSSPAGSIDLDDDLMNEALMGFTS
ncbi:mediator of RNA polymerase II transcription subunit 1-like [Saccostrea echinata]|uniref:mediator of RNA polymerase II transcription subunit 1-like n=1 Tax=Saccostrea echinata TaxID=191078 RepID=UPI002A80F636|nr:mediator of RNA polymerase II transcription subunit 1-like [Saccostrea echinata]